MLRFNESTWPGPAEVLRPERSLNSLVESDGESFCGSVIPAWLAAPPPQETRPAMLDLPNRRKPAHQVSRDRLAIQRPGRTPPQIGARGSRGVPARHGRPILQGGEIYMMKAPAPRTTMPFLGPYYYGKHKWDNYLLDIQETLESGNAAHRQNIRLQSGTLDVARKQVEELRQQTEQLSNIEQALQNGFEGLRAEFEWGFTLMVDRMDTQINLLSKVAEELDAIHQTLKSPLINQAQELFRLGEQRFNEGLWDKALKDFLESEKKNEVHPLLQLQIGKLYLFGRSDSYNLIDLPEAERHLLLAAWYADAKKKTLTRWSGLCGQAYFYAGVTAYLIGEQEQAAERPDSMRACLERALAYLAKAANLWPQFTEIIYTQAKCHALLGQIRDSTQKLEILSDRDRRYYAKTSQDGDFAIFRAAVDEVFRRATISPGPFARAAQAKSDGVAEAIAWAKRSTPGAKVDLAAVEAFERELANARRSLTTLDVDIEALSARLSSMKAQLEKIAQRSLQHNIDASQNRPECTGSTRRQQQPANRPRTGRTTLK